MKHILPTDTINKVLNYLASKAYSEVAHLIQEIKSVAIAVEQVKTPDAAVPPAPPAEAPSAPASDAKE